MSVRRLVVAALLAAVAQPAVAGPAQPPIADLLSPAPSRAADRIEGSIRSRAVQVKGEALDPTRGNADRVRIELFPDTTIVAEADHIRRLTPGYFTWTGRVSGVPGSRVVLVNAGGRVVGTVWMGDSTYEIGYARRSGQTVAEIASDPVAPHPIVRTDLGQGVTEASGTRARTTVIDVVIAYTQRARSRAGGKAAIEALAMLAVEGMNDALRASDVDVVFRLIHVGMVDYRETDDPERDLYNFSETDRVSQAKAWRNNYGADAVMLFTGRDYGGAAELPGHFAVVGVAGRAGAAGVSHVVMTAAHMWGHNLGAGGEPDSRDGCGIAGDACAHVDARAQFATIMSHGEECDDCLIAPLFSNPDVDFSWLEPPVFGGGVAIWDPSDIDPQDDGPRPAGRNGRSDNARTISRFAPIAAQWRPTLTALPTCRGVVATWVGDNGDDVFRGTDGPDVVVAKGGDDRIDTGEGADVVCAGPGRDDVDGGGGNDFLFGEGGRDTITGAGGEDLIDGGPSADDLFGGSGSDLIRGGSGNDDIGGGVGNDALEGGPGDDRIDGETGDDRLAGGDGDDDLEGGPGRDWLQPDPGDRYFPD